MYIASNIKFLRKSRGWTQEQLAQKLNKTYITIGDYERGKALPPLNVILELCGIFEVDIAPLVLADLKNEGLPLKSGKDQLADLEKQLETLQRLSELQGHRVAELEREIRLYAPELARKLGLE
jgi:transcriptional regulator with XRE-family HTH domain